jgi:transcriptional regulator with GAF, ATPase, and Fis domain
VVGVGWPADGGSAARMAASPRLAASRAGNLVRITGAELKLPFTEVLCAPCVWREELMGLVAVADKETRAGRATFDDEDATFLRSLALLAAPAIASCRALEEEQRQRLVLEEENRALRAGAGEESGLIGQSHAMRQLLELTRRVAPLDVTVLLRGESGTGKERVARLLHTLSPRQRGPFVPLNCAAVPETLLEAELFGIERGVATGVEARIGKFELANGGTLFLDEVGDLSAALQAKLLRVVQEREVERVGGRQRVRVDVRLITATNRDLEAMMASGTFREDLYYRLRVVELPLPPLRDRREDVPLLSRHFVRLHGRRLGRGDLTLSREALELLLQHDFPGNVRELENVLEAAVALASGSRIEADDIRLAAGARQAHRPLVHDTLDEVVRAHVLGVLERCHGNRAVAARTLGIDRSTLYRMMMRWNATHDAQRNDSVKARYPAAKSGQGAS